MLDYSQNKYTFFLIPLFLLSIMIFQSVVPAFAQQHPISGKINGNKGRIPDEITVKLLSIKLMKNISLSSGNISITSQEKKVEGSHFNISMSPNSREIIVSGSSMAVSMLSPVTVRSKNPVLLKITGLSQRPYRTPLYVRNTGEQLIVTCKLPVEEYIAGVVMGEMPQGRGAALLAQAVVARAYMLKNLQRHKNEGYDFCDCTHCQVYKEAVSPDSPFHAAALATRGLVLLFNGNPVEGLYHSTCGGYTSDPEDVYGAREQGIRGIKDVRGREKKFLCAHSPHFYWEYRIKEDNLRKVLGNEPEFGALKNIEDVKVERKDAAGRVITLAIGERERTLRISGYDFWQIMGSRLGWGKFKSALFTVEKEGDSYIFKGRGLGHGLGLCQWGAMRMAEKGCNFREILKHYFPDAEIRNKWR